MNTFARHCRNNGGHLEASEDSRLRYGEIEYVRKHSSQLVCACSEDAAREAAWACNFARVNTLKCLTSATENEGPQSMGAARIDGTVLSSKWPKKVFSFFGSKTSVSVMWLVFRL